MKKNKILTLIMTGILTLGIMTGCGAKEAPESMATTLIDAIIQDNYEDLGALVGEEKATQVNKAVDVELKDSIKNIPGSNNLSEDDLSKITGKMKEVIKGITYKAEEKINKDYVLVEIVMESKDISEIINRAQLQKEITFDLIEADYPDLSYKLIDTQVDLLFFDAVGNEMVNAIDKQVVNDIALRKEKKDWAFEDLLLDAKRIARELIFIY